MEVTEATVALKAVLLDWAGTTVDFGSRAPVEVFVEIFRRMEVEITIAEAREPMGRAKRDHIATIARQPRVEKLWRERYGKSPSDADIDSMYREFLPLQLATLSKMGSEVLPGVAAAVSELRSMGLRIGSSTGYTHELMEVVAPLAARDGYAPDVIICSGDTPAGRPAPWMNFLAAQKLNVYPMSSVLVADDTPVGIQAGINAGAPTVAISLTGNALGLSESEVHQLAPADLEAKLSQIEADFLDLGADYVLRSAAELPGLIRQHFPGGMTPRVAR